MAERNMKPVLSFLIEKWGKKECPMCGKGPWQVQDKVFQLSEYRMGQYVVGGPLIPVTPVTCTNCGYTVLVNSIICGIVERDAMAQGG